MSYKYNLHTHSMYCGHGTGNIYEYVQYAEKAGFDVLGFSEHCPFPDDFYNSTRMAFSQRPQYENDVHRAKKESSIKVLLGYECDYFPKYRGYFEDLREKTDFLISGTHLIIRQSGKWSSPFSISFSKSDMFSYCASCIEAIKSNLFLFIAHPDVFLLNRKWDEDAKAISRDIIEAALESNIPLEINGNGIIKAEHDGASEWGYPNRNFWALASSYGIKAVCSLDAHRVRNLDLHYSDVYSFADQMGIKLLEPAFDSEGKLYLRNRD